MAGWSIRCYPHFWQPGILASHAEPVGLKLGVDSVDGMNAVDPKSLITNHLSRRLPFFAPTVLGVLLRPSSARFDESRMTSFGGTKIDLGRNCSFSISERSRFAAE
jgi:hypothetical protein